MNPTRSLSSSSPLILAMGAYAMAGGALTLTGWFADIPRLTSWDQNGISMMPNTAVCAILSGSAVILLARGRHRWSAVLGSVVVLIGAATLFEHLTAIDLGIDRRWPAS